MSLTPIAAALADAAPAPDEPAAVTGPEAGAGAPAGKPGKKGKAEPIGSGDGTRIAKQLHWPDDMPVEPLGHQGLTYYYLDESRQLQAVPAEKHSRAIIFALFGKRADVLLRHWGKRNKDTGDLVQGFHADQVANALMTACARKGLIDPARQLRMPGAWTNDAGHLVLHVGDRVMIDGEYHPPGEFGGYIYPATAPTRKPATAPETTDAGGELAGLLQTWNWGSSLHSALVLGWIAQGFVTGALHWRSHVQLDGERGTGKSSLMELIKGLMGNWMLAASNVTPAAIYQLMAGRAQPLFLDEFEAGSNVKRKLDVVALLREASSGGLVLRGGDDHVGRSFSLQFGAFVTSIVPVMLQAQDESRMVKVQLRPLKDHPCPGPLPDLSPVRLEKLGRRLWRRMIDQWHRWPATLAAYRRALEELAGFDARMQDTYGTLLALHDLSIADRVEQDVVDSLAAAAKVIVRPQIDEADRDQDRCLAHLLQSPVERGMGVRRTVASWLRQACAIDQDGNPDRGKRSEAHATLGAIGLKPMVTMSVTDPVLLPAEKRGLFVVNEHPGLGRIFQGTQWPGEAGAHGAWVTVLRRCEGAEVPAIPQKVGGMARRGTRVPLRQMMDWDDEE